MRKVIETNISLDENNQQIDFQSRVIEVDDWYKFIEEIENGETKVRTAIIGNLTGASCPRQAKVEDLKYDNNHLNCFFFNGYGDKFKKLAYLINE